MWEFVDGVFAEEAAEREDARVVGDFEDGAAHLVVLHELRLFLFGVGAHGAEFEHAERLAVSAAAHLGEDGWAWGGEPDADPCEDEEREGGDDHDGSSDLVDEGLDEEGP